MKSLTPFSMVAGHPALDFVNTLDARFEETGPSELLHSYNDLLGFLSQSKLLPPESARILSLLTSRRGGAKVLRQCRMLRENIAACLYASLDRRKPDAKAVAALERVYRSSNLRRSAAWREGQLVWQWSEAKPRVEFPLWALALNGWSLLTSPLMKNVRGCGNPTCRWLFLDSSKNRSRRWCDMKVCGNRMKGRRFRAQHKRRAHGS